VTVFWRCVCPRDLIATRGAKTRRVPHSARSAHTTPPFVQQLQDPHPKNLWKVFTFPLFKCRTMITVYSSWRGHWVAWLPLGVLLRSLDILKYLDTILTISHRDPSILHEQNNTSVSKPTTPHPSPITQRPQAIYINAIKKPHASSAKHDWLSQMISAHPTN
jgi:hypothetical protein